MHKVLVVDDDHDLLEMVEMALSKQGFVVETITNGESFFREVDSFKPHLILLDIFLGDADGRRLCYELKLAPAYQHIPVILYSAGVVPGSSIVSSMANAFVNKPFEIKQLSEKIKSLLAKMASPNLLPEMMVTLKMLKESISKKLLPLFVKSVDATP